MNPYRRPLIAVPMIRHALFISHHMTMSMYDALVRKVLEAPGTNERHPTLLSLFTRTIATG
jgi:hypothetical protein